MSKTFRNLFLVRHAEAVPPTLGMRDDARPLTEQGKEDAMRLGSHWQAAQLHLDKVVASPAVRTAQTAYAVAEQVGHSAQSISLIPGLYDGDEAVLNEVLHAWNNAWKDVLIVSHLPVIQRLAHYLTNDSVPMVSPCGYVHLTLPLDWWRTIGPGIGRVVDIKDGGML